MKCRVTKFVRPFNKVILAIGVIFMLCTVFILKLVAVQQDNRFSVFSLDVFQWKKENETYCNGNYIGYAHRYFELNSTVYIPSDDVFTIFCDSWNPFSAPKWTYWFHTKQYAQTKYTNSLKFGPTHDHRRDIDSEDIVFVVNREYPHNFYHAMTQWYNLFILSKIHGVSMKQMVVLLLDRGPHVHLDEQWSLLFGRIIYAKDLSKPMIIKRAIFNIAGHESPMYYFNLHNLPFIEEFSSSFLENFNLKPKSSFDCKRLNITLVFRRDYYMHPGVSEDIRTAERKFKNEEEIIRAIKAELPGHRLNILVAENMSLPAQLQQTTHSDVLIGMHGCVLTHTLFLPKHALVFEMYPNFWAIQRFFSSIAKWRNIRFQTWQNKDSENEFSNHYTYIPRHVIRNFAQHIKSIFACENVK